MSVKPIREGFHTLTPYLMVEDAGAVADFLQKAFDAELLERFERPDGSVMHMEMRIGDSMLMLGEPMGEFGPMPASVYVYSEDCDGTYKRALKAGGTSVMEPTDMRHAWRTLRRHQGPRRQPVVDRHPHRRPHPRRTIPPHQRDLRLAEARPAAVERGVRWAHRATIVVDHLVLLGT
ncbi:MAG TPA: VOC family protein [Acidobacteriota bacterium]|nr:VOC family protein [Acidobacteriota bacterium]